MYAAAKVHEENRAGRDRHIIGLGLNPCPVPQ